MRTSFTVPAGRAGLLRAATAAVLALGYLDLVRGGTTLAPVLLLVGYLALVPALILTSR